MTATHSTIDNVCIRNTSIENVSLESVPLKDVLITSELFRRGARAPGYAAENRALVRLAREMAQAPHALLQCLVERARELCKAGSTGISLMEAVEGGFALSWPAIAGTFAGSVGGVVPRDASPCGVCLERGTPQLFRYPEHHFACLSGADPPIAEALVVPIIACGQELGTLWVVTHDARRRFDGEDARLLTSLSEFTAAALQILRARDLAQQAAREIAQAREKLEVKVQERTRAFQQSNRALQETTRLYQTLAEALPQLVWMTGPDGRADYLNKRWITYTGCDLEESLARGWHNLLAPEDCQRAAETWAWAVNNEQPYDVEYRLRAADGLYRWFLVRGLPLRNAEGVVIKWVGTCTDIHARKETEAQLRQSETRIQGLNARLQQAMMETHHRVKNNLQVIAAMVDIQTMEAEDAVPIHEMERLSRQIRALAVVHDVLTKNVQEEESAQRISSKTLLEKMLPLLQQITEAHPLEFSAEEALVTTRQGTALALCVQELHANAIKHGKGSAAVRFTVHDRKALLEVSDDGAGFAEDFNPIKAANTGLDLVLTLVRSDLGGRIAFGTLPEGGGLVAIHFSLPDEQAGKATRENTEVREHARP